MTTYAYVKFENPNITGTGTGEHAGEIEVLSWNHGFQGSTHERLTFTKYIDSASAELLKTCWTGRIIAKATLRLYRSDGVTSKLIEYLSVVMEHVVISDLKVSGGPGNVPVEEVSLDYAKVTYHYIEQHASGERLHSASLAKERPGSAAG